MQGPVYFDNEMIKPSNMEFDRDSNEKNIKDYFKTLTSTSGAGTAGIVSGLTLSGVSTNTVTCSIGVGYDANGERIEVFSNLVTKSIATNPNGTYNVYLTFDSSPLNPNPVSTDFSAAVQNVNPTNGSLVNVRNYNKAKLDIISGTNSTEVPLGQVVVVSSLVSSFTTVGRTNLKIAGALDLNTSTISGSLITNGTLNSDKFSNPLTTDITIGANTDIIATTNNKIGSSSNPISSIYSTDVNVHNLNGFSPIIVKEQIKLDTGKSIESVSGPLLINTTANANGTNIGGVLKFILSTTHKPLTISLPTTSSARISSDQSLDIFSGATTNGTLNIKSNKVNIISSTGGGVNEVLSIGDSTTASYKTKTITESATTNIDLTAPTTNITSTTTNISGKVNVSGGLSSLQGNDNLIKNSEFSLGGNSGTTWSPMSNPPQIWTHAAAPTFIPATSSIKKIGDVGFDSTIYNNGSDGISDTYLELQYSGSYVGNDNINIDFDSSGYRNFNLSFYYKYITTADPLISKPSFVPFVRTGTINSSSPLASIAVGTNVGAWSRASFSFSISNASTITQTLSTLIIRLNHQAAVATPIILRITNMKLTKGVGDVKLANKNTNGVFNFPSITSAQSSITGSYANSDFSKSVYSYGNFSKIDFDDYIKITSTGVVSSGTFLIETQLLIDSVIVKKVANEWSANFLNNGGTSGIINTNKINYSTFLPTGTRNISIVTRIANNTITSGAITLTRQTAYTGMSVLIL